MTNGVKHFLWREGRPRWHPSPTLRALGMKGKDLKDELGRWLTFDAAVRAATRLNDDAADLQQSNDRRVNVAKTVRPPKIPLHAAGYVYFVYSGGLIKIGFSKDPFRRIDELRTGLATPVDKFLVVRGHKHAERKLHDRFAAERNHREWFKPTAMLEALILDMVKEGTADLK